MPLRRPALRGHAPQRERQTLEGGLSPAAVLASVAAAAYTRALSDARTRSHLLLQVGFMVVDALARAEAMPTDRLQVGSTQRAGQKPGACPWPALCRLAAAFSSGTRKPALVRLTQAGPGPSLHRVCVYVPLPTHHRRMQWWGAAASAARRSSWPSP